MYSLFSFHLEVSLFLILGITVTCAQAATEIQWWSAMGDRSKDIVAGFNASQSDYVVKAVCKGNYAETMTAGIAAFRSGTLPHILQVANLGTLNMMAAEGAVYSVYKLLRKFEKSNQ